MDNEEFIYIVLAIVDEIPVGKVASYKQIATLSGYPRHARQVGKIMNNADFFGMHPCHRVVHQDGGLVIFWNEQKELLLNEGIEFHHDRVNMKKFQW